jgi:hypothetical protein
VGAVAALRARWRTALKHAYHLGFLLLLHSALQPRRARHPLAAHLAGLVALQYAWLLGLELRALAAALAARRAREATLCIE